MTGRATNCWEFTNCGREAGGDRADSAGGCPASTAVVFDGTNRGTNGGRVCWAVAGTLCAGRQPNSLHDKFATCLQCRFYREVEREENRFLVLWPDALRAVWARQRPADNDGGTNGDV